MILRKNIDPNNNFYNNIRSPCKYYTEDQFIALKKCKSGISFIHFNARGLRTNFNKIENLLNEFESPFDVIAISETWLESDDCTDIMIEGYKVRNAYMSTQREVFEGQTAARQAKRGGLWKGGPGVLPLTFSKTCIANGGI